MELERSLNNYFDDKKLLAIELTPLTDEGSAFRVIYKILVMYWIWQGQVRGYYALATSTGYAGRRPLPWLACNVAKKILEDILEATGKLCRQPRKDHLPS